jgi:predicted HicB family RNase H-like nuclease
VDTITFAGRSVDELRAAFRESVDDYLEMCERKGRRPDHPYSGTFSLRLGPQLHRAAAIEAARRGLSLNGFVADALGDRLAASGVVKRDVARAVVWTRERDS